MLCTTPEVLHKLRLWLARLSMALSLSVPLSCSSVAPPPRAHHAGLTGPARCSSRITLVQPRGVDSGIVGDDGGPRAGPRGSSACHSGQLDRPPRRREGLAQRGPGAAGPQPGLAAAARRADRRSLPATPCDSPMRPPRGARLRPVSPEATSFLGVSSSLSRPACCPPDASRNLGLCKSLARESRPRALFGAAAGNTRTRARGGLFSRETALTLEFQNSVFKHK